MQTESMNTDSEGGNSTGNSRNFTVLKQRARRAPQTPVTQLELPCAYFHLCFLSLPSPVFIICATAQRGR